MLSTTTIVFAGLAPIVGYFFMRVRRPAPFISVLTGLAHVVVATYFLVYAAAAGLLNSLGLGYGGVAMLYLIFGYLHLAIGRYEKRQ